MRRSRAEVGLSLGVLGLGLGAALVTALLPSEGGYARVGPNFIPAFVSLGLVVLGAWLLLEAFTGGWRHAPPDEAGKRGEHHFHLIAFVWVSFGLFLQMLLIGWAGFVVAQTLLFACVARAFGNRRTLVHLALGFALSLGVYLFFVHVLNVNLPAGWLEPLAGSAGF